MDRYVRVYRKDSPPCEDELAARRRGEPWNDQIKQQLIEKVGAMFASKPATSGHFRENKKSWNKKR